MTTENLFGPALNRRTVATPIHHQWNEGDDHASVWLVSTHLTRQDNGETEQWSVSLYVRCAEEATGAVRLTPDSDDWPADRWVRCIGSGIGATLEEASQDAVRDFGRRIHAEIARQVLAAGGGW